jgi:hypothetical protein
MITHRHSSSIRIPAVRRYRSGYFYPQTISRRWANRFSQRVRYYRAAQRWGRLCRLQLRFFTKNSKNSVSSQIRRTIHVTIDSTYVGISLLEHNPSTESEIDHPLPVPLSPPPTHQTHPASLPSPMPPPPIEKSRFFHALPALRAIPREVVPPRVAAHEPERG